MSCIFLDDDTDEDPTYEEESAESDDSIGSQRDSGGFINYFIH